MISFIVYDDTPERFKNAKNHVYNYLLNLGYNTNISKYSADNNNILGEDDRICVTTDILFFGGDTFLNWTKEAEAEHEKRFLFENQLIDNLIDLDLERFHAVCDGDKLKVSFNRNKKQIENPFKYISNYENIMIDSLIDINTDNYCVVCNGDTLKVKYQYFNKKRMLRK